MQDEGAAIMGLGHTLMEHYIWDDAGRIRNLGAIDYRIPTSMDLPEEMVSDMIENGDGPGPYGAKGMSEGALLPVAAAVAAAVRDATGVVIRDLPLHPSASGGRCRSVTTARWWLDGPSSTSTGRRTGSRSRGPAAPRRRQGGQPDGHGGRPRPAGAAGVHADDGRVSRVPRERLAGRLGRRAAHPHVAVGRPGRSYVSAARATRFWSASDPGRRCRCPG